MTRMIRRLHSGQLRPLSINGIEMESPVSFGQLDTNKIAFASINRYGSRLQAMAYAIHTEDGADRIMLQCFGGLRGVRTNDMCSYWTSGIIACETDLKLEFDIVPLVPNIPTGPRRFHLVHRCADRLAKPDILQGTMFRKRGSMEEPSGPKVSRKRGPETSIEEPWGPMASIEAPCGPSSNNIRSQCKRLAPSTRPS